MPEIFQVEQLVIPLRDDSDRVFDKGHHDEEPSDGGEVPFCKLSAAFVHTHTHIPHARSGRKEQKFSRF